MAKRKTSLAARKFMQKHIKRHIEKYGMSQRQAVAAAYSEARNKGYNVGKGAFTKGSSVYTEYKQRKRKLTHGQGFGLLRD